MIVEPKGYYDFLRAIQDPLKLTATEQMKPEDVMERHRRALEAERRANEGGRLPVVCVAGKHDYHELMGALMTLYGLPFAKDKSVKEQLRLPEIMGIVTVKSYSFDHGFFFGSEDREQEEAKKPEPTLAEKIADQWDFASDSSVEQMARKALIKRIETVLAEANAQK